MKISELNSILRESRIFNGGGLVVIKTISQAETSRNNQ